MRPCPHETFPALSALPVIHAFTQRVPGLDVKTDRETALARLENPHAELRVSLGLGARFACEGFGLLRQGRLLARDGFPLTRQLQIATAVQGADF